MNKNRAKRIVKDINTMFGAELAYIEEGRVKVTGERTYKYTLPSEVASDGTIIDQIDMEDVAIDYYGDYRGGYPWIDERLEKLATKEKMHWEWDNPAVITMFS